VKRRAGFALRGAPPKLKAAVSADGQLAVLSYALPERLQLTRAERQVAVLLLEGKSHAEIARTRGSAPRTVANQVASLFQKLGIHSRAELLVQWGERILTL
jgi:DNA-binding NarL/FixJ family response regulator